MSEKLVATNLPPLAREGKPRERGVTIASDHLKLFDRGMLEQSAEYLDTVKIGKSLPLLVDRAKLLDRIRYYHDLGIKVQSGGTLIQVAYKRIVTQVLERLRSLGFDTVEISESATELPREAKENLLELIGKLSMGYVFEVGKKEPGRPAR